MNVYDSLSTFNIFVFLMFIIFIVICIMVENIVNIKSFKSFSKWVILPILVIILCFTLISKNEKDQRKTIEYNIANNTKTYYSAKVISKTIEGLNDTQKFKLSLQTDDNEETILNVSEREYLSVGDTVYFFLEENEKTKKMTTHVVYNDKDFEEFKAKLKTKVEEIESKDIN